MRTSSFKVRNFYQILVELEFIDRFFLKRALISNFIKILPLGVELYHADEHTDRHEVNNHFSQFVNSPKNWQLVTLFAKAFLKSWKNSPGTESETNSYVLGQQN